MANLLIALAVLTLITAFCWASHTSQALINKNKKHYEKNTINNLKAHYKHNINAVKACLVADVDQIPETDYTGLKAGENARDSIRSHRPVRFTVHSIKRGCSGSSDIDL